MSASTVVSSAAAALVTCAALSGAGAPAGVGAGLDLRAQLRRGAMKELGSGKLLVAARNLPDPNFAETVVLLAEMNDKGAMGLIVNRRTDVTLARVAPGLEMPRGRPPIVFFGGPVAVPGVLALLRTASARTDTRRVFGDVHLVNTREALQEALSAGNDSDRFRVYVGYAGWGEGQLETEAARGAWHVSDADAGVVFDPEPDSTWQRQIRRTEALQARNRHSDPTTPSPSASTVQGAAVPTAGGRRPGERNDARHPALVLQRRGPKPSP